MYTCVYIYSEIGEPPVVDSDDEDLPHVYSPLRPNTSAIIDMTAADFVVVYKKGHTCIMLD